MLVFKPASFLDPALTLRQIEDEFAKVWTAIGAGGGGTAGGTPGGSSGQLQWNSAGAFAGLGSWDGAAIFEQRNLANAQSFRVYNIFTDTLNYERGVFDWKTTANTLTIGTQAAGSGSVRDVNIISASGNVLIGKTTTASLVLKFSDIGIAQASGIFEGVNCFGLSTYPGSPPGLMVPNPAAFGWSNNNVGDYSNNLDTFIYKDSPGVVAQRNGTIAQSFRVYNTSTDASNYERGVFGWQTTPNALTIGAQSAGTGAFRPTVIIAWTKAGAPVAADIPAGTFAVIRDTVGSTTKLYYNNAGTLQSVALA